MNNHVSLKLLKSLPGVVSIDISPFFLKFSLDYIFLVELFSEWFSSIGISFIEFKTASYIALFSLFVKSSFFFDHVSISILVGLRFYINSLSSLDDDFDDTYGYEGL